MAIKLSSLRKNPDNPRICKDKDFHSLIDNMLRYPEFMELRPIVHKEQMIIAGNQRYEGIQYIIKMPEKKFRELVHSDKIKLEPDQHEIWDIIRKDKEIPDTWVKDAQYLSEKQIKAFIILDNHHAGKNDWEMLANSWDKQELEGWGVSVDWYKEEAPKQSTPAVQGTTVSFTAKPKTDEDIVKLDIDISRSNMWMLRQMIDKIKIFEKDKSEEEILLDVFEFYILSKGYDNQ